MVHTAYIGIGSNLGDPEAHVTQAIARLAEISGTTLHAQSSLYRTAPLDADGNDYVNAVACIRTTLPPPVLMSELHRLEREARRRRPYRNAPRTLDLDILLYDDLQIHRADLVVPHPRMTARAFVLVPLLEIAPSIIIPGKGPANQYLELTRHQAITLLKIDG